MNKTSPAPRASSPNNTRAQGGYDAYFGTYSINDQDGTVTTTSQGEGITRTLTWKRVD